MGPRPQAPLRILVVDDHLVVRTGLVSMINDEPDLEVVAECSTGAEAEQVFDSAVMDLVVVDLRLPDMDGIAVTARLRGRCPDIKVVVLTTYHGDEDIYRSFQAGAGAYLVKDAQKDEILQSIRAVADGSYRIPEGIAEILARRGAANDLSPRELQILTFIARGLTNKEIAGTLELAENTVKNHVKSLLSKLSARDRTQAVTMAIQRGILQLG